MFIKNIEVTNYKSFLSSGIVPFAPGMNFVVGQNNAGKTALLEALSLKFGNKQHVSLKTKVNRDTPLAPDSKASINFLIPRAELLAMIRDNLGTVYIPSIPNIPSEQTIVRIGNLIADSNSLNATYRGSSLIAAHFETYSPPLAFESSFGGEFDETNQNLRLDTRQTVNKHPGETLAFQIAGICANRIYAFRAERLNVGQTRFGARTDLNPDASNLAEVLNNFHTRNPKGYDNYNKLVSLIFPEILFITIPTHDGDMVRISIWMVDPESQRDDLAIPLQESGTGIGQVLAMLYVVMTSQFPRTLIIDEPQSFLHPGAIRKLLDIFQSEFGQHQYIISTHSPYILSTGASNQILQLKKGQGETKVEILSSSSTKDLRSMLVTVGARLSDVFGSEKILWVEGATEERCFPKILQGIIHKPLLGVTILGLLNTGDLESKRADQVLRIYQKLSEGASLLPPAVGFILDRESRSPQKQAELQGINGIHLFFTPRRMYENYLLNPSAIASVMSALEGFRETAVAEGEISNWIETHKWENRYFAQMPAGNEKNDTYWLSNVDGAKLLAELFLSISDKRFEYDKVLYGEMLTDWITKNSPNDLQDIVKILNEIHGLN